MNLHIHHVFSDVDGVSAQAIMTAILAGERDADKLAKLRDRRCRGSLDKVKAALVGDYREEYLFVLRQCQQRWQQLCAALLDCDQELATRTAALTSITEAPLPAAPATQRRVQKNMPLALPIYSEAHRLLGVDLSAVPGICQRPPALPFGQRLRPLAVSLRSAAADASSKPAPAKSATGSPTSCAWRPMP